MNTTLFKSLSCRHALSHTIVVQLVFLAAPNELSLAELSDLVDGLAKLDANVVASSVINIMNEFFKRCADTTPQQVELFS